MFLRVLAKHVVMSSNLETAVSYSDRGLIIDFKWIRAFHSKAVFGKSQIAYHLQKLFSDRQDLRQCLI